MTTTSNGPDVAIIDGPVARLATAEKFFQFAGHVDLYEQMTYDEERTVNCGEGFTSHELIPLEKTHTSNFLNYYLQFTLRIHLDPQYGFKDRVYSETELACGDATICDRHVVENAWADRVCDFGVSVHAETTVSSASLDGLTDEYDIVVGASGNPLWASKALVFSTDYTGQMVAFNADVSGDVSDFYPEAHIIHEGMHGYFWVFPKSERRANVEISWEQGFEVDDYSEDVVQACDRHNVPRPERSDLNVYIIPAGPTLDDEYAHHTADDAAGTANRYQGESISQAIRSSYHLTCLVRAWRGYEYLDELYRMMKSEYWLAMLMKGLWDEFEDLKLLADVTDTISHLNVEEVIRHSRTVYAAIARRPRLAFCLARNGGMRRCALRIHTDHWEYVEQ